MPNITFDASKLSPEEAAVIIGILGMRKAVVENATSEKKTDSMITPGSYWYITPLCEVESTDGYGAEAIRKLYNCGNCFATKEIAEYFAETRRITHELLDFAARHNDFNHSDMFFTKYFLAFDIKNGVRVIQSKSLHTDGIFFTSAKTAHEAIAQIGEDRLKKYYFGINS